MNIADLLAETQTVFVSDPELGAGESISYKHKVSTLVEETKAFVSGKFNKEDGDVRADEFEFTNVVLAEAPKADDKITYNGTIYEVTDNIQKFGDMYIIPARAKARHNGRPKRRSS